MSVFTFFLSLYRKVKWLIALVFSEFNRVYPVIKAAINEVAQTDLENEAARKAVFQKATDAIQSMGIKISDSRLNFFIEMAYQLYKNKKA
jgi:hypothetical protein